MSTFKTRDWVFYGRVLPDLPPISLEIPTATITSDLGFKFDVAGQVHNSKLMIAITQRDPTDVLTLKNAVANVVQGSVDIAGFFCGAGLDVDIISARAHDGEWRYFDGFVPALQVTGQIQIPTEVVVAAAQDRQAQILLQDFRAAIRMPGQTGFFCYRAIEAAMQSFRSTTNGSEQQAWTTLRSELNVDRSAIDRVKVHADWARHGKPGSMTDEERLGTLTMARTIIGRYLDYITGGRRTLDTKEYQLLK